ncbi:MAG: hypothetical protein ABI663_13780 [Chryseolinea sp.]
MNKRLIWFLGIFIVTIGLAYVGYRKILLPYYVARIILNDETSKLLPKRYEKRIVKSRKRISSSIDSVLVISYRENISLEQLLRAIDEVKEEQVYKFLDELNTTNITSSDQVFDIGKKHFKADFDVELFRAVFQDKAPVDLIKKGLALANKHREDDDLSPEIIRSVAKQLLIEKDKKYNTLDKVNGKL